MSKKSRSQRSKSDKRKNPLMSVEAAVEGDVDSISIKPIPDNPIDHQEELLKLYRADDGASAVDMTRLDKTSGRRHVVGIFATVIVLLTVAAAVLGAVVFSGRTTGDTQQMTLTMSAPTELRSGDQLELTLQYQNQGTVAIDHAEIELVVPAGWHFNSSNPQPETTSTNKWFISRLAPGASSEITITGQLVGQKEDRKDFTALLTYTPENFSSDFQASSHVAVILNDSILQLEVTAPESAHTGEEISYVYSFTNTATLPLTNVKAVVKYPAGFEPTSADPTAQQGNSTWQFDQLDPGASQTVTVKGEVTATSDGTVPAKLEFVLQVGLQQPDGWFAAQVEDTTSVKVINPQISLSLTAPHYAAAGGAVDYAVTVQNVSEVSIADLTISLAFTEGLLDASTVTLDSIDTLEPDESITLNHTVTLTDSLPDGVTSLHTVAAISNAQVDDTPIEFVDTASADTTLQGAMIVAADGRYYEDDLSKLGSGPIPPQVGETTSYVIRWSVTASGSTMSAVTAEASLGDGATYVGSSDDRISYDAATNTVTLNLKTIEAGVTKSADFKVSVTPVKADLNKLLVLTNPLFVSATDGTSQQAIQAEADKVTTKLTSDPGANDDGVVVASN